MARLNKVFLPHCYLLYEIAACEESERFRHVLVRWHSDQLVDGAIATVKSQLQLPESTEFKLLAKVDAIIGQALLEAQSLDQLTIHTIRDERDEPWRIIGTAESAEQFRRQTQPVFEMLRETETYSVILVIGSATEDTLPELSEPYPTFTEAVGLMLFFFLVQILTYIPVLVFDIIADTKWTEHLIPFFLTSVNSAYWVLRYGLRKDGRTWSDLWPRKTVVGYTFAAQFAAGFGLMLLTIEATAIALRFLPDFTERLLSNEINSTPWMLLLSLVLLAPIAEESIFRGVFLHGFLQRYSKWKSILIAALLFAIMHLNPAQSVVAFFFGLLAGWYYTESNDIWTSILGHAINNGIVFIILWVAMSDKQVQTNTPTQVALYIHLLVLICGSLLLGIGIIQFRKGVRKALDDAEAAALISLA